jgi:hypothetical protein
MPAAADEDAESLVPLGPADLAVPVPGVAFSVILECLSLSIAVDSNCVCGVAACLGIESSTCWVAGLDEKV